MKIYRIFFECRSLGEVNVVVYVILAEAVISGALRAVAELKIGIVGVCAAAHGALMGVELVALLLTYAPRFAPEVYGVRAGLVYLRRMKQIAAAEYHKVQQRHDGEHVERKAGGEDIYKEERGVDVGEPLYLDRDDEEQQYGHVRVERRKGEEHREIDVCRRDVQANAGDKVDDEGEYLGENDAGEEKYRELRRTPVALQRVAYEIIKIESEQGEKIKADRVEYEADEPPDLPVQNGGSGERQVAHQNGIDKTQQPEHDVSADDVFHQVRDAEVRVLIAEAIDIVHGLFHIEFLLGNAGRFARRVCAM